MIQYVIKTFLSAALIVFVAEVSKRSALVGSLAASLPLVSLLSIVWLYFDTGDKAKAAQLTSNIFWMVLPSLVFFLTFPALIRRGLGFFPSLAFALGTMCLSYLAVVFVLKQFGVKL